MRLELSFARGVVSAAVLLILSACASEPGPAPPTAAARGGYVDAGLAAQAAAFEGFTRRAGAIPPGFGNPGDIAQGLQTGAAYDPRQLEAGMIAYAAMAALQEPGFVAGVRRMDGRDLARRLATNPAAALDLPGGGGAAGRANAALARRGEVLSAAGQQVRRASYSVQHQAWSRARVPNAADRLARVKRAASYQRADGDTARLVASVSEGGRRGGASPVIARGVALAALTVVGQDAAARPLLAEPKSSMCLRLAKLNFHQCLASAGTHYEDIYCLGVHAMAETGQCVVAATKPGPPGRRAAL